MKHIQKFFVLATVLGISSYVKKKKFKEKYNMSDFVC